MMPATVELKIRSPPPMASRFAGTHRANPAATIGSTAADRARRAARRLPRRPRRCGLSFDQFLSSTEKKKAAEQQCHQRGEFLLVLLASRVLLDELC
jgi:hypothetical protein